VESPAYHAAPLPAARDPVPLAALPTPVAAPPAPERERNARAVERFAAGVYGVMTLFAVGYAVFSGTSRTLLGTASPTLGHVLAAVGIALLVVAALTLAARSVPLVGRAWAALGEILGPIDGRAALVLAAASGVAEELLFRGALWPHLGLVGTSLLFGLVHVVPKRALLVYPAYAAAMGFLLGLLRQGSESVLPAMLAHALLNGVVLVTVARRTRPAAPAP
jgi:uncharacterized protein